MVFDGKTMSLCTEILVKFADDESLCAFIQVLITLVKHGINGLEQ